MAIFNQSNPQKKDAAAAETPSFARDAAPPQANTDFAPATLPRADFSTAAAASPTPTPSAPAAKESLIASDLTIEGKIEGSGHVRIAGTFKGDVNVEGDLSLERGAKLNGGVRAKKVVLAGELDGNIEAAQRVELLESAAVIGDIKAGTLTVAAGSKIRGHIDCGWEGSGAAKGSAKPGTSQDA
jgi:cytoskeletal protein CcmA (bactofilin family)